MDRNYLTWGEHDNEWLGELKGALARLSDVGLELECDRRWDKPSQVFDEGCCGQCGAEFVNGNGFTSSCWWNHAEPSEATVCPSCCYERDLRDRIEESGYYYAMMRFEQEALDVDGLDELNWIEP